MFPLNNVWLRDRVTESGLKQWWLAEQVGVDRKTVIRWLHEQVRAIHPANAAALAGVLGCAVDDFRLQPDAMAFAGGADQRAAGLLLANSSLLDKLGPVGEWDVIEQLLKAVLVLCRFHRCRQELRGLRGAVARAARRRGACHCMSLAERHGPRYGGEHREYSEPPR